MRRLASWSAVVGTLLCAACASVRSSERIYAPTGSGQIVPIDSLTTAYDAGGVPVIQRSTYANDVVAVDLYLLGGVRQLTPADAGVETLALRAAEYGTASYPDTASRFALARTGSRIVVEPEDDWTRFGFRGVIQQFDSTWNVFADRIVHPTLDDRAVALVRARMIREVRERDDSPDGAVRKLADSVAFRGHPYGLAPAGTEQTLSALTAEDVRRYAATQFVTSRLLLVVVGNVPRERVERLVRATLGQLPRGAYLWSAPPTIAAHRPALTAVARPLSTNYLLGYFHGPSVTSADYPAFEIATGLLASLLDQSIRRERSLSYAAYAEDIKSALATGGVYVSTDSPAVVIPLIREQMDTCRQHWFTARVLDQFVQWYITSYLIDNETNEAQARSLARAQIYLGDYRLASDAVAALRRVTPGDVLRVSQKYMHDVQFAYVGDSTRLRGVRLTGM